jgi:osmotically inducible protein OsmC
MPKELGGPGLPNTTTPEHLFAAGYAACFGSSLERVAGQHKRNAAGAVVTCATSIGPREGGGFGIAVAIKVEVSSLSTEEARELVQEAHEKICPYSHATCGNIDVSLEVIGK